ncbi:hypothetical protein SAMN04490206_3819 [Pseudomonas umsongensis]|jgi:hypothetical protein|nr:hypothetical protein PG5_06730 [Pseudomonas sp. G5(2012)]SDT58444.1 hypothetical protein SAMN04490206_3819 [Pseudomonas umsongensis]
MVEDLNTLYYFTQVVEHQGFALSMRSSRHAVACCRRCGP